MAEQHQSTVKFIGSIAIAFLVLALPCLICAGVVHEFEDMLDSYEEVGR